MVKMASQYIYRCYKTSWGIYIGMTAELISYTNFKGETAEAVRDIYLSTERAPVSDVELGYLKLAIRLVEKQLRQKLADRLPVVIHILAFDIAHNDYDVEGMTYVMLGWLAQETDVSFPLPDPKFDKTANRYIFDFQAPPK
jgi:hypothetical protein